jgi:adenylate cyclase class 1
MPRSAQPISFEDGISRKDLKTIRQRFLKLQQKRLARIQGELSRNKQRFLDLLPLLFHINHPMLPGFVNSDTPNGLPDYSPSYQSMLAARRYSRSFQYKRRAQRFFQLQALYLMGSTGSIGQSSKSDFDLWLCYGPNLNSRERVFLQQKAHLVEKAGFEVGLEVHIFLVDTEAFRRGERPKLSFDSSGSTQHSLLLEEFYRSAVLLAGRYPLWWLVPPEKEGNYRAFADNLLHRRFIKESEVLDLGGLDQPSADEFFGAALWQLYKGIDSPYKSILKILLMEAYSRDYPETHWLAQQAKAAVYADDADLHRLDSYILLYERVERYLKGIGDSDRLELARRCFYFKVGEALSRKGDARLWRRKVMLGLTRDWGWGQSELQRLDERSEWKIDQVIQERNTFVGVLSRSYRLLTEFARKYAKESQIDPMELNLLGRKLYSELDHRPGKIESVNPGISKNLTEPRLALKYRGSKDGEMVWMLYRDQDGGENRLEQRPIKITAHLIEMLLWSQVNQVWGKETACSLLLERSSVSRKELLDFRRSLERLYPAGSKRSVTIQNLGEPAALARLALFINIGADPLEPFTRAGVQLTSDRHDPLSFAAGRTNLVLNMEELVETSWGELFVTRREGDEGLLDAICNMLDLQGDRLNSPAAISAFSFSSVRGYQIAARVEELFTQILEFFAKLEQQRESYIFRLGRLYYLIGQGSKGFEWRSLESYDGLIDELEMPVDQYRALDFDTETLQDTPLPTLYRHNQPDIIQLFYQIDGEAMRIYLLDEKGRLFQQSLAADSPRFLMMQQRRFLNSLQQLRNLLPGQQGNPLSEPEFYEIKPERHQAWLVERRQVPLKQADDYMELTLVCDGLDATARPLALICGEEEFSRLEYGDDFYQVTVDFLRSKREGRQDYPIYLTALRVSGFRLQEPPSTVEMLRLKKKIEERLNSYL